MERDRQNEWTQPPDCNPGAETQQTPDEAVRFRISSEGRAFQSLVTRLATEGEEKREALNLLDMAIKLLVK